MKEFRGLPGMGFASSRSERMCGRMPKQLVSDEFWARVEPLLPKVERRFRYPGRKRIDDRLCLEAIHCGSILSIILYQSRKSVCDPPRETDETRT